ncbi:MAG TPA: MATE family efflux transporter [Burkholderiaceae bacterium]|nr:MATE family efflux transporter [Burkholderiaceae bacterium]
MSATVRPAPPETSPRAILRLAGPLFFANLAVVGNGTIDTVMAGRLSAVDMAGVAVASSVYVTVYIGFMAVLQALSPIAGHHFGAHRWRQIGHDVQQALWLAATLALAAVPSLLATGFWSGLAGVDGKVADIMETYLEAVAFGVPAGLATRVYVALNAAVSRPTVTMVVNLTVLALKAPLNAVFMYGAGPIAPMGGAGAGVATAILAWLALLLSAGIWHLDHFYDRFRSDSIHGPRASSLKELLKLGLPIGLSTIFEVTSFTFMTVLIARIGAAAVAGHQVVANLVALLFMVPLSLGIATSVLVAQSLGAGAPRAARDVTRRGYSIAMSAAVAAALTLWALRERIVALYTADPDVTAVALSLLSVGAVFHVFDAAQGMGSFVLRGYRQTFWPMLIYGVALWGLGLGGGMWIGFYTTPFGPPLGALGFWLAAVTGLGVAAAALVGLTRYTADAAVAGR